MILLSLVVLGAVGCAGTDARCTTLCEDDGVGDTCNADSISRCLSSCEARISGVTSLCATCLIEEARFREDAGGIEVCMSDDTCPEGGRCPGSVCDYCIGDAAEEARCNPPEEVRCTVSFRDSTECASVCVSE